MTYRSVVLLQHLHVRVVRQTLFADRREIGCFPSAPIQILLNLRHSGSRIAWSEVEAVFLKSRYLLPKVYSVSEASEYVVAGAQ